MISSFSIDVCESVGAIEHRVFWSVLVILSVELFEDEARRKSQNIFTLPTSIPSSCLSLCVIEYKDEKLSSPKGINLKTAY